VPSGNEKPSPGHYPHTCGGGPERRSQLLGKAKFKKTLIEEGWAREGFDLLNASARRPVTRPGYGRSFQQVSECVVENGPVVDIGPSFDDNLNALMLLAMRPAGLQLGFPRRLVGEAALCHLRTVGVIGFQASHASCV
jgi:hypothetical protein